MVRLLWSRTFEKSFGKLTPQLKNATFRAIAKFKEDLRHPSLRLEKLQGLPDYWSIRVNLGYRIVLHRRQEGEDDVFTLVGVGPHDIYRRV